jgi:oligopeptidase B
MSAEPVEPAAPRAPRHPRELVAHGDRRVDDWYWLRERDHPETLAYLQAENAWADRVLAPTEGLQSEIVEEIRNRVVETDCDAPVRNGEWWYWSRTLQGAQYRIACRRHDPARSLDARQVLADARSAPPGGSPDEEVVLDENELAGSSDYFALGVWDLTPDQRVLAYATDLDGSERYVLRFRDFATGEDRSDRIEDVTYGSAWSADGRRFFYVRMDEAMRPYQVWCHELGTEPASDRLVYEDPDERFFVSVAATRSRRFVLIHSASKMTAESLWIDATDPTSTPTSVLGRTEGVELDVEHARWPGVGDVWLVRTNRPGPDGEPATDFALYRMPVGGGQGDLVPVLAHRPGVRLAEVDAFATHVVVTERSEGLERLRILDPATGSARVVEEPEPVYSLLGEANPEWEAEVYRYGYTSLVTPRSTVEVELSTGRRQVVRVTPVNGYDPGGYRTERLWASAPDGTRVPISVVASSSLALDGTAPCLLYGYGAYEISVDPTFSPLRLSLLERGVVFAIAHVRGGGEMGRSWYEQGRLEHKTNTFTDFVACAEHLIDTGWADKGRLAIRGGSAGGLLMGAVTNLRPELWSAVVAEVPFVDVVTTMSDTSLPLTVTEWEEWGDPVHDPAAYARMKSYSPYDNVAAVAHPAMYVTGGLNDPRVGYWEPAKWVAKLRALSTGTRTLVLRTELDAGHQGVSGRYAAWRDEARVLAFVLTELAAT